MIWGRGANAFLGSGRVARLVRENTTTDCVACRANHAWLGPVLVAKIFRFAITPNHSYNSRHPVPTRGAYRDRHGRWVRDAMDAAASGARGGSQGELRLVSDHPARRRTALKRLRRNLGRQHMSRSRGFGGGSRGRQRRVVLAPVAGVKLAEIVGPNRASADRQFVSDGGKRNSSPGRARYKP
jgi:hypothetical protein